jgi:hypothetical protein
MTDPHGLRLVGTSKTPLISLSAEDFGTPGARVELHIVPQFENRKASDAEILSSTKHRAFRVSAKLSHAPSIIGHIGADFSEKDGDSFLILPSNAAQLRIDTLEGRFHIKKNDAGRVSFVEMECFAETPQSARTKFISAVYPALDHFAYAHNVALFVPMIRVMDIENNSYHVECIAPYRPQMVPNTTNILFEEMKPVYAMYREAKNTDSGFYKFLCCYKIMEGLLGKMRGEAFTRVKARGVDVKMEKELVPYDKDLAAELKVHVGKPMKAFFDKVLTKTFRHAVAHFVTDDGILQTSSAADLGVYTNLAFITDLCARQLIATHERLLAQIQQA